MALRQNQGLMPNRRKYTLSISGLYGLLSVSCILLSFIYWKYKMWIFAIVNLPIAILVYLGISSIVKAFSLPFCERYEKIWEELKKGDSGPQGS